MEAEIISMAQQARPNWRGQTEFLRPQLYRSDSLVVKIPCLLSSLRSPSSIGGLNNKIQVHAQVKIPFRQAQTSPSTSRSRNTIMAIKAPTGRPVKATANGSRKMVS